MQLSQAIIIIIVVVIVIAIIVAFIILASLNYPQMMMAEQEYL